MQTQINTAGKMDDGVEITPEMIEAGASVLCRFETFTAGETYWAAEVYRAMALLRPSSAS
jgi:hypothetical protein